MDLKLGSVLNSNIDDLLINEFFSIGKGEIFKDYIPIQFFNSPVKTKMVLGGIETEGEITLTDGDYNSHEKGEGKPLETYTFNYIPIPTSDGKIKKGDEFIIKIKGSDMYNPNIKTPALEMDKGYNTLTDKIGTDSDDTTDDGETESGDDQNVSTDEETFNNLDSTLKDLKSQVPKLKSLDISGKADADPNFRRNLVLNFANSSKTNIKVQGKSLFDMLKKLSDDKIVEKGETKWTDEVSKFFNDLLKLFSELHKCCKENKLYIRIKKFLKNLYEALKNVRGKYKDKNERDVAFVKIVREMSDIIGYISSTSDFSNQGQKSESIIKEEPKVTKITFKDFNTNNSEVFNKARDLFDNEAISPREMERLAFKLYGKDAGKFFPKLSLKFKDIKNFFGVGVGGIQTRQDKLADKYGIYNLDSMVGGGSSKSMDNTPKYKIKFDTDVNIEDVKNGIKIKIDRGEEKIFNYNQSQKVLVHKTSGKKFQNVSQIFIEMDNKPEEGKSYNEKITKIIPIKGGVLEKNPNYKVRFTIVDTTNKE
jgi:hypothetical protein